MVTWEFGANVVKIGERKKDEKWLPERWGRRGKERQRGAEFFFFFFWIEKEEQSSRVERENFFFFFTYTLTYFTGKW